MSMCDSILKIHGRASGWGLLFVRVVVAFSFIIHGMAKWSMWSAQPSEQTSSVMINLMKFLSVVEPLGGLALLLGLFTSFAAGGLAIIMLGAIYFNEVVWKIGFISASATGWEYDLALLALCVVLFVAGPGRMAVDGVMCKRFCKHEPKNL